MAWLGTLIPEHVFLMLNGFAYFVVLALWVMKDILCLTPLLSPGAPLTVHSGFGASFTIQIEFNWQTTLATITIFHWECLEVMPGADSYCRI